MQRIIYALYNTLTKRTYVGQTYSIQLRMMLHRKAAARGTSPIASAIRKHGWASFELRTLATTRSLARANELERYYIGKLRALAPAGYNVMPGGFHHPAFADRT